MPVTMEHFENGRIVVYTLIDPWTVEELTAWYPQDAAFRDALAGRTHTIIDATRMGRVPPRVIESRHGAPGFSHPRRGYFLSVGSSPFAKTMAQMVFRLARLNTVRFMDTMDEAWAFLRPILDAETAESESAQTP